MALTPSDLFMFVCCQVPGCVPGCVPGHPVYVVLVYASVRRLHSLLPECVPMMPSQELGWLAEAFLCFYVGTCYDKTLPSVLLCMRCQGARIVPGHTVYVMMIPMGTTGCLACAKTPEVICGLIWAIKYSRLLWQRNFVVF